MFQLALVLALLGVASAGYAPVPGHKYLLKESGTGKYLALLGSQEDIRDKRGAEQSYTDPVRNFTVTSGLICDL
jgi:hypothetical protein